MQLLENEDKKKPVRYVEYYKGLPLSTLAIASVVFLHYCAYTPFCISPHFTMLFAAQAS